MQHTEVTKEITHLLTTYSGYHFPTTKLCADLSTQFPEVWGKVCETFIDPKEFIEEALVVLGAVKLTGGVLPGTDTPAPCWRFPVAKKTYSTCISQGPWGMHVSITVKAENDLEAKYLFDSIVDKHNLELINLWSPKKGMPKTGHRYSYRMVYESEYFSVELLTYDEWMPDDKIANMFEGLPEKHNFGDVRIEKWVVRRKRQSVWRQVN